MEQVETSTEPELAPPRVSLTSLPAEILSRITHFTDRNSFLALQRTSLHFLSLDDRPLWEHLQLTLPQCFGSYPFISPFTPMTPEEEEEGDEDSEYLNWLDQEERETAKRYRLGLRDKVKQIIKFADDRRWGMVRSVTMSPLFGSLYPMLLLLDYVHPTLEKLEIDSPLLPTVTYSDMIRFPSFDFCPIGDSDLPSSFPNLTHLHLISLSSTQCDLLSKLCDLSPNLLSLDVHFANENYTDFECSGEAETTFAATKIRRLRFSWDQRFGTEDYPAAMLFIALLGCSPEIRQVVLRYRSWLEDDTRDRVLTALSSLPNLEDLQCPQAVTPLVPPPTLRRLIMDSEDMDNVIYDLPETQDLATVYIRHPSSERVDTANPDSEYPGPFPYDRSFYYFADGLRFHKSLRTIRPLPSTFETDDIGLFDKLNELESEDQSYSSGLASSIICGAEQLILLQFPQVWQMVEDRMPLPQSGSCDGPERMVIAYQPYDALAGAEDQPILRERVFERQAEATLCTLADYQGEVVPLEIVEAMRVAAGASVKDWDRRGVEVGGDVWKILEDWYATVPKSIHGEEDSGTDSEASEDQDGSD